MLKKKFTFIHMVHSDALEAHANERLEKLEKLIGESESPHDIEVRFKSNPHGAHNEVELNLHTKNFRNCIQCSAAQMYDALDECVTKMVTWLKKEKDKMKSKQRKVKTPKSDF